MWDDNIQAKLRKQFRIVELLTSYSPHKSATVTLSFNPPPPPPKKKKKKKTPQSYLS